MSKRITNKDGYSGSTAEIKDFITNWNINFPIDRWWRKKYKVAFNSLDHREVSFLDMRIEWEEDQIFNRIYENGGYVPNKGDYLKPNTEEEDSRTEEQKQEDFKKDFFNTDLSQFDDI